MLNKAIIFYSYTSNTQVSQQVQWVQVHQRFRVHQGLRRVQVHQGLRRVQVHQWFQVRQWDQCPRQY